MANIKVANTNINGLYIIEPFVFFDNRGNLFESYNTETFTSYGLITKFVQDNEIFSKKGVLRGMHVNLKCPQAKLVRVLTGEILDVVIDLRKESSTYLSVFSINLSAKNKKQLYIPEGLGHGYLSLQDSQVLMKVSTHFIENDELGFAWNSKVLGINWGIMNPILSERDKCNKDLYEVWE